MVVKMAYLQGASVHGVPAAAGARGTTSCDGGGGGGGDDGRQPNDTDEQGAMQR